jgi:hypothetical protein
VLFFFNLCAQAEKIRHFKIKPILQQVKQRTPRDSLRIAVALALPFAHILCIGFWLVLKKKPGNYSPRSGRGRHGTGICRPDGDS